MSGLAFRVGMKGRPFGVCALEPPGEIMVNFAGSTLPGCYQGVPGQAELEASDLGAKNVMLQSSVTALRFYRAGIAGIAVLRRGPKDSPSAPATR
jgi:hypothetical protein